MHFASAELDAIVVNISTAVTSIELANQLQEANVSVILSDSAFEAVVRGALALLSDLKVETPASEYELQAIVWVPSSQAIPEDDLTVDGDTTTASAILALNTAELHAEVLIPDKYPERLADGLHTDSASEVNYDGLPHAATSQHGCDQRQHYLDYQMYFTSGTTGSPKLITLTHEAVCQHALATAHEMRLHSGDVWLHGYVPVNR